jgi:hypothetical protein
VDTTNMERASPRPSLPSATCMGPHDIPLRPVSTSTSARTIGYPHIRNEWRTLGSDSAGSTAAYPVTSPATSDGESVNPFLEGSVTSHTDSTSHALEGDLADAPKNSSFYLMDDHVRFLVRPTRVRTMFTAKLAM